MENEVLIWQLPVSDKTGTVAVNAKAHCFEGEKSLCGRYFQNTDYYETDVDIEVILKNPQTACKKCLALWKQKYSEGLPQGRE
jgi:hypothetical protein|nr:MAG TPA: hypothetical protein [Caudoviricetes sp.]